MAEEPPGKAEDAPHSEERASRRRSLTPEQRRLLGRLQSAPAERGSEASSRENLPRRTRRAAGRLSEADGEKVSRSIEFQGAILIIAVIVGLGLAFYFGTKIGYLKYLLTSRDRPSLAEPGQKQFRGMAVADLVEQHNTILMANHGVVAWSHNNVEDAYFKMEILEAYCRTVLVATQLGKPVNTMTAAQLQDLLKIKQSLGIPDPRFGLKECELCDNNEWRPGVTCAVSNGESPRQNEITAPDPDAESLVQQITDQIMSAVKSV